MARLAPVSHVELVRRLRTFDFTDPYSGGKHLFMVKENLRLIIPNPHRQSISADLLVRLLRQAGIGRDEWDADDNAWLGTPVREDKYISRIVWADAGCPEAGWADDRRPNRGANDRPGWCSDRARLSEQRFAASLGFATAQPNYDAQLTAFRPVARS